jgi:hypothetical protein
MLKKTIFVLAMATVIALIIPDDKAKASTLTNKNNNYTCLVVLENKVAHINCSDTFSYKKMKNNKWIVKDKRDPLFRLVCQYNKKQLICK